ncbi:hypothetical protein [Phaeobacter gallaeciensis]|nr:hypothetical protein [Phaeobacter gallaeciensis]
MRNIRLTAFRVVFREQTDVTFEQVLNAIAHKLPRHEDRVHAPSAASKNVILSRFLQHPNNTGVGAILSAFEPGASISALNFLGSTESVNHSQQPAQDGTEFLDRDFSLLAIDDFVIGCSFNGKQNYISAVLHSLALRSGVLPTSQSFNFVHIPRKDTWEQIVKWGVKKIRIDATMLLGDAEKALGDTTLSRLFGSSSKAETLKRQRQNTATLTVKTSKKFQTHYKPGVALEEQDKNIWLDSVAKAVLDDDDIDNYTIILNNNQSIKSGSLLIEEVVSVAASGSSYNADDAHQKMLEFYRSVVQEH